ncbi:siderophore-interacting protein [Ruegeria sp. MALMAid1280]|uniref:siderophore-interacting protein n=1 Tax=Ruegeria sp. MALMAid1280 TaxID=3411634 RepID=UPI003B9F7ADA
MTIRPQFACTAETHLPDLEFNAMKMVMLHRGQESDLPVVENSDTRVTIEAGHGHLSFAAVSDGIRVTVMAEHQDWLFMLKEGFVEQLDQFMPGIAEKIRWSDAQKSGELPPNFHFATVQSVRPVGTAFVRVRVQADGLSSFQEDAIHFRIVLPSENNDLVEWPYVSENGTTVWPKGEKALHRPVYTTRWIDHATGLMDFDVFLHEGGRVTEWVGTVQEGTQVALVGPGGGGVPGTNRIVMFADETALPAVARILEALPADTLGHVTVQAENGADCAYPLTAPSGVSVTWLAPDSGESLADLGIIALETFPNHFLWFACEKAQAQKVRAVYKKLNRDPSRAYIAAYWNFT